MTAFQSGLFAGDQLGHVREVAPCPLCDSLTVSVDTGGTRCLECARDASDAAVTRRRGLNQWWKSLPARGARFSTCELYRYELWRKWSDAPPYVALMLNPSTADEVENDPTVERQERRARAYGYGGLFVLNIFAYRSTDPKALYYLTPEAAAGEANDATIRLVASMPGALVVCGWGKHGNIGNRGESVRRMLAGLGVPLFCLEVNKDGTPKHPLYCSYERLPVPFPSAIDHGRPIE